MSATLTRLKIGLLVILLLPFISMAQDETTEAAAVEPETAMITFYRTGSAGGAVQFHVHNMDGEPMGYLGKSGDSFTIEVPPGTHQFWSRAASRSDVVLNVEAEKHYYVQATVKIGLAVGRPVLKEVPESKVPAAFR